MRLLGLDVTLDEELSEKNHGQDDADDAQRVCDGAPERSTTAREPELLKSLLSRAERGRVGCRPAIDTHHFGQVDRRQLPEDDREDGADKDEREPPEVQLHAVLAQRVEKAGAHLQPQCVDKDGQAKRLGVEQHIMIKAEADVTGKNSEKKNKSHAERNAPKAHFGKCEAERYDGGEHGDRLLWRMGSHEVGKELRDRRHWKEKAQRRALAQKAQSAPRLQTNSLHFFHKHRRHAECGGKVTKENVPENPHGFSGTSLAWL